ncbi:hypothetical protein COCCADRAFT_81826, partial [Bipolaris zeicola 26-R-13]
PSVWPCTAVHWNQNTIVGALRYYRGLSYRNRVLDTTSWRTLNLGMSPTHWR